MPINPDEKEYYRYFIRSDGKIMPYHIKYTHGAEKRKEIGNDFGSEKEAEIIVEKFKELKELQDLCKIYPDFEADFDISLFYKRSK